MVAMENFEKGTVAMLGGPCMQHVTGNTSRLNQPQSAIICDSIFQTELKHSSHYQMWKKRICNYTYHHEASYITAPS